MSSSFGSLQIAYSALKAQQQVMETIGHNIANVSTDGYTRQRVDLAATPPTLVTTNAGTIEIGGGVQVINIARVMDQFVNAQLREQSSKLAEKEKAREILAQVESVFAEPGEEGLGAIMTEFWNSWEQLTLNPESLVSRRSVINQAQSLANAFSQLGNQLTDIQNNVDFEVTQSVAEINSLASQVADLNRKIMALNIADGNANDLEDSRDKLVSQLQSLVGLRVQADADGEVSLYVGNRALVQREAYNQVQAVLNAVTGFHDLAWAADGAALQAAGGQIAADVQMRDTYVPALIQKINDLLGPIITNVNSLHADGYDLAGNPVLGTSFEAFFTGATMEDVSVNPALAADPSGIAASLGTGPGDAENARRIASLADQAIIGGAYTFEDYYRSIVASLGIDVQSANNAADNAKVLKEQIEKNRESVSGVSLDEEMVRMTEAQHAYNAAARAFSILDAALDTLINNMGAGG